MVSTMYYFSNLLGGCTENKLLIIYTVHFSRNRESYFLKYLLTYVHAYIQTYIHSLIDSLVD
jgi:hypothetical protein